MESKNEYRFPLSSVLFSFHSFWRHVVLHLTYIESHDLCPAMLASCMCVCVYTHSHQLWISSLGHVCLDLSSPVDDDWFECSLKVCRRSRGIAPLILNLGARRRLVASFMPRPLYLRGTNSRFPLNRKLGGSQIRSGRFGEEPVKPHPDLNPIP